MMYLFIKEGPNLFLHGPKKALKIKGKKKKKKEKKEASCLFILFLWEQVERKL